MNPNPCAQLKSALDILRERIETQLLRHLQRAQIETTELKHDTVETQVNLEETITIDYSLSKIVMTQPDGLYTEIFCRDNMIHEKRYRYGVELEHKIYDSITELKYKIASIYNTIVLAIRELKTKAEQADQDLHRLEKMLREIEEIYLGE